MGKQKKSRRSLQSTKKSQEAAANVLILTYMVGHHGGFKGASMGVQVNLRKDETIVVRCIVWSKLQDSFLAC